jgi:hypothetical protein
MKKCTLLIILCAVFSLTSIAQTSTSWKQVNTEETTDCDIRSIFMLDQNLGYFTSASSICNTPGTFKTIDGDAWNMFNNISYIEQMFVFSENLLYFCSNNKIIKYDNGIYTTKQYEETSFRNICFSSDNVGWCFGNGSLYNGMLYKTTDAGNSWTNLNISLGQYGGGLYATDDNNVWIGGQQKIMYSSNGGTTWVDQILPIPENREVQDIQMLDQNTGYAVGRFNGVLKTTNGGTTWILKEVPDIPGVTNFKLHKVFFISETEGYVVGRHGYIAKTTDGGETWIQQNSGTDKELFSVFFLNSSTGWIGGADGFLAYTDRGGEECTITADFTISGHCPTSEVNLINTSTGSPLFELGYTWKLDGEAFSNLENPPALPPMEAGTYNISLEMEEGNCISIKSEDWTIYPIDTTEVQAEICGNSSHNFYGEELTEAGTYYHTLTSVNGCDSVIKLDLTVNPTYVTEVQAEICDGGSHIFYGEELTEAGTYYHTLTSVNGCDSIIKLDFVVNPNFLFEEEQFLCQYDTLMWHGQELTEAGSYTAEYETVNGCDSIYQIQITIAPAFFGRDSIVICAGETYSWHGQELSETGVYTKVYETSHGCDSIYELELFIAPFPMEVGYITNPTNGILEPGNTGSLFLTHSYSDTYYWTTRAGAIYTGLTQGSGGSLTLGNMYTQGTYEVWSKTEFECSLKQGIVIFTEQGSGAKIIATPSYGNEQNSFEDGAVKLRMYQFTQDINNNDVIVPMGAGKFTINGNCEFDDLDGDYYLKSEVVDTASYPTVIPVYFYDGPTVDSADLISLTGSTVLMVYINHPVIGDTTGTNTVGGYIIPAGGGTKSGGGIPDQVVILRNETTGQILSVAISDENGNYFISKVPNHENVELYVTSFEYQNWTPAHLQTEINTHYNVNFIVDDNAVYPQETGIQTVQNLEFKIYPNPSEDLIYIENIPENAILQIFDMQGRLLIQDSRSQKSFIDISTIPSGQYIVVISHDNKLGIEKLIKQ